MIDCKPHLPHFRVGIRLVLFRFHSPLLTESLLISFPPPTKMLQFGGFPIAFAIVSENTGSPIQPSADPRHSCVSPQLIAACHDLHRHSSRAIPQLGCSITYCMYSHTMRVTLRYLIHAYSASSENRLLMDDSPQPFPHHDRHDRVLSNHPTFHPYKKKSVYNGALKALQSMLFS